MAPTRSGSEARGGRSDVERGGLLVDTDSDGELDAGAGASRSPSPVARWFGSSAERRVRRLMCGRRSSALLVALLLLLAFLAGVLLAPSFQQPAATGASGTPSHIYVHTPVWGGHVAGGGGIHTAQGAVDVDAPSHANASTSPTPSPSALPALPPLSRLSRAWVSDADEAAQVGHYFDVYDADAHSFVSEDAAHAAAVERAEAGDAPPQPQSAPPSGRWWSGGEAAHSVGQFPFDVSHRRFVSSPSAYAKWSSGSAPLPFDPAVFRSMEVPAVWGDEWGHAHWNREAERQFYHLIREQQYPSRPRPACHLRQYVVLEQWDSGLFSRFHQNVELWLRALHSGREIVVAPRQLSITGADKEDLLREGYIRYFLPISDCAESEFVRNVINEGITTYKSLWRSWERVQQLLDPAMQQTQFWWHAQWTFLADHWKPEKMPVLPHQLHMFAFGPGVVHPQRYASVKDAYAARSRPAPLQHVYPHPTGKKRSAHHLVHSFFWHMLNLWHYRPLPRIQMNTALLRQHWAGLLVDSKHAGSGRNLTAVRDEYPTALHHSAAWMVRRGDKAREDPYAMAHGNTFRDISLYAWPMLKRSEKIGRPWSSLFFMSDDPKLLAETEACARAPKPPEPDWDNEKVPRSVGHIARSTGCRSVVTEYALSGVPLTWNAYAPQSCFNPFNRIGFEQFLVSMHFVLLHSDFLVAHSSSNVGRIMAELLYATRQLRDDVVSLHSVYQDAVDDYKGKMENPDYF